jgi:hypothetical protein
MEYDVFCQPQRSTARIFFNKNGKKAIFAPAAAKNSALVDNFSDLVYFRERSKIPQGRGFLWIKGF